VASYDVKLDNNNNLYVVGINKGIDLVNPLPYSGLRYTFIAEFDTDLDLIWSTYYGGTGLDYIKNISFDNNNDLIITGRTTSTDFPVIPYGNAYYQDTSGGGIDAFIAKFSNNIPVWATYLGGDGEDIANGICSDQLGNYYIVGSTMSTDFPTHQYTNPNAIFDSTYNGNDIITHTYNGDAFLSKFNNLGEPELITYYGDIGDEGFSDVSITNNNNIYITGATTSDGIPFASPNLPNAFVQNNMFGFQDGMLISLNSDLELQWTTYLGGPEGSGADWTTALTITNNNKLYMVGYTSAISDFPLVESPNSLSYYQDTIAGNNDGFITKFDILIIEGIEEKETRNTDFNIFPNPTADILYIKTDEKIESYRIYNITGQQVKSGKYNNGINIKELSVGIYLLKVNMKNKSISAKIIKN